MKIINIKDKPSELLVALETMKKELPVHLEVAKLMAEIRRSSYLAYIKQGFTPEQALELCKQPT